MIFYISAPMIKHEIVTKGRIWLEKCKAICDIEKVRNHPFRGLDGLYISARNAEIIDLFARASLSPSVSSSFGPCIWRIDAHCSSLTLLIFAKKSLSGFQQFFWLNGGGATNAPFLWAKKPRSTLKKGVIVSNNIYREHRWMYRDQNQSV